MFSDPQKIVSSLHLSHGAIVCDMGAGSGFYTLSLAKLVGGSGKIYAVDIQKDLLSRLAGEAKTLNLHNVEVIWGDAEKKGGTKLKNNLCDLVVVTNVLFQAEQKANFVEEAWRILKPGGELLLVDWENNKKTNAGFFEAKGFREVKNFDAGSHHYGMMMQKAIQ